MRPIRWKSSWLTGRSETDNSKLELVNILNQTARAGKKLEHCQDLNDFFGQMSARAQVMLRAHSQQLSAASDEVDVFETELSQLLQSGLPLAARTAAACTDCCICSMLEKQASEWLGEKFSNRSGCDLAADLARVA